MTYTELRLFKYRVLIIATLLTLCSLVASCQVTKVDSGFLITRDYAEYIAARFDSLETYKKYAGKLQECDSILYHAESVISAMKVQYNMQSDMLKLKDQMIQSYERGNVICNDYAKQLKKEKRMKKVWKITTISFISLSFASLIYIAI